MQAEFTETEPSAESVTPAVGDRYAENEIETTSAEESTPTGVTTEKPATEDLAVEELSSTDTAAEVTPTEPESTELGATEPAVTEPGTTDPNAEPAPLETPAADP